MENVHCLPMLAAELTSNVDDNRTKFAGDAFDEDKQMQILSLHLPVHSDQERFFSKDKNESTVDKQNKITDIRLQESFQDDMSDQNGRELCTEMLTEMGLTQQRKNAIQVFTVGTDKVITLSEVSGIFENHFKRPDLLKSVLQTLQVAVSGFKGDELARVDIPGGLSYNDHSRGNTLYIAMKDVARVLQYTSALLDINPPNVTWVQVAESHVAASMKGNTRGLVSSTSSSDDSAHVSKDDIDVQAHVGKSTKSIITMSDTSSQTHNLDSSSAVDVVKADDSNTRCTIRTCLVNGEEVVCIPDLHKTVIDLFGQSVQVGNYMNRLKIPTHRFSSNCLKYLKAHNILSSKATLCTYITKADAERLLNMYHLGSHYDDGQDDSFPRLEWSEPIILENSVNTGRCNMGGYLNNSGSIDHEEITQPKLIKIPLFTINNQVVISMPDVHKAVQLVNGQSVQLRYNLDKLSITKYKYSYSEVHHLKILGHLNRPSSCTYITKTDVDRLLQYYITCTPENEPRLKLIEWQQPLTVERIPRVATPDRRSSAETEAFDMEANDENNADAAGVEDYSISDLYKVFVGDDLETTRRNSSDNEDNQCEKTVYPLPCSSSASESIPTVSSPLDPNITTSVKRSNETSTSDNQVNFRGNRESSSHLTTSEKTCDPCAVNPSAVNVDQMQVVTCIRTDSSSERSGVLFTSGTSFGQIPVDKGETDLPSGVAAFPPSSSFTTVSTHSSGINSCVSSFVTQCGTTFVKDGQILPTSFSFTSCESCACTSKRSNEQPWLEQQAKKYRADEEDVLKTLQRKETEMRILYDAYQEQIKQGRDQRLSIQRELDQLRDSNAELIKSIERKELEMKILHDSYQVQMELERKKCEELEKEVLQLKGKIGVKQEPL
ncbi:ski oncogene-like isoform X2 [Montipora foliosa]